MVKIPVDKYDDWIAKIADPDDLPDLPPQVIVLFGYLSDADKKNSAAAARTRYRLYLTLQLDQYLVIQQDDILHFVRVPNLPVTPLGGMLLWVKPDAVIVHVSLNPNAVQASYLQGPLTASAFVQAQGAAQLPVGGASFACPGGGASFACPGGGTSFACPGGGGSFACPGGSVSFVVCR